MPPSPITYQLSNRQKKELLLRGQQLKIALPIPPVDYDDDPLTWAKSVLPTDIRDLVVEAREEELWVKAIRTTGPELDKHLGVIVDPDGSLLVQCVIAVVVTLRPRNIQGKAHKIQWPATVIFHGKKLP